MSLMLAALVPEPKGALLGQITPDHKDFDRIAKDAARTIPGRENGGNCKSFGTLKVFQICNLDEC